MRRSDRRSHRAPRPPAGPNLINHVLIRRTGTSPDINPTMDSDSDAERPKQRSGPQPPGKSPRRKAARSELDSSDSDSDPLLPPNELLAYRPPMSQAVPASAPPAARAASPPRPERKLSPVRALSTGAARKTSPDRAKAILPERKHKHVSLGPLSSKGPTDPGPARKKIPAKVDKKRARPQPRELEESSDSDSPVQRVKKPKLAARPRPQELDETSDLDSPAETVKKPKLPTRPRSYQVEETSDLDSPVERVKKPKLLVRPKLSTPTIPRALEDNAVGETERPSTTRARMKTRAMTLPNRAFQVKVKRELSLEPRPGQSFQGAEHSIGLQLPRHQLRFTSGSSAGLQLPTLGPRDFYPAGEPQLPPHSDAYGADVTEAIINGMDEDKLSGTKDTYSFETAKKRWMEKSRELGARATLDGLVSWLEDPKDKFACVVMRCDKGFVDDAKISGMREGFECIAPLVNDIAERCAQGVDCRSRDIYPLPIRLDKGRENPWSFIKDSDPERKPLLFVLELDVQEPAATSSKKSNRTNQVWSLAVAELVIVSDRLSLPTALFAGSRFWVGIAGCRPVTLPGDTYYKITGQFEHLVAKESKSRSVILDLLGRPKVAPALPCRPPPELDSPNIVVKEEIEAVNSVIALLPLVKDEEKSVNKADQDEDQWYGIKTNELEQLVDGAGEVDPPSGRSDEKMHMEETDEPIDFSVSDSGQSDESSNVVESIGNLKLKEAMESLTEHTRPFSWDGFALQQKNIFLHSRHRHIFKWLREDVQGGRMDFVNAKEITLQIAAARAMAEHLDSKTTREPIVLGGAPRVTGEHLRSIIASIEYVVLEKGKIMGVVLPQYYQTLKAFICDKSRSKQPCWSQSSAEQKREVACGILQITKAFLVLHDARIFHFDIDDANIMLDRVGSGSDARTVWRIIDFGGARTTRSDLPGAWLSNYEEETPREEENEFDGFLVRTRPGFGHVDKLPPEARGKKNGLNIRILDGRKVDVYQWGVVVFNLLFPKYAFPRAAEDWKVEFETALKQEPGRFDPDRYLNLIHGETENAWIKFFEAALHRKPAQRATMADLLDILHQYTEDELIEHMNMAG